MATLAVVKLVKMSSYVIRIEDGVEIHPPH